MRSNLTSLPTCIFSPNSAINVLLRQHRCRDQTHASLFPALAQRLSRARHNHIPGREFILINISSSLLYFCAIELFSLVEALDEVCATRPHGLIVTSRFVYITNTSSQPGLWLGMKSDTGARVRTLDVASAPSKRKKERMEWRRPGDKSGAKARQRFTFVGKESKESLTTPKGSRNLAEGRENVYNCSKTRDAGLGSFSYSFPAPLKKICNRGGPEMEGKKVGYGPQLLVEHWRKHKLPPKSAKKPSERRGH